MCHCWPGATTVLYEGKPVGTPDPRRILEGDRRAPRQSFVHRSDRDQSDPARRIPTGTRYGRSRLSDCLLNRFSSPVNGSIPDTYHWATEKLGVPVIDHWWQTEYGWVSRRTQLGVESLPFKPGSPSVPMPGYRIAIPAPRRLWLRIRRGRSAICLSLPLPPGTFPGAME